MRDLLDEVWRMLDRTTLAQWHSLDVDYEPPRVKRLWIEEEDYRFYLHEILPIPEHKTASYHPHPWASYVKIIDGYYKMQIGYGDPFGEPPPVASTLVLSAGSMYSMTDPRAWHSVAPKLRPCYSIMVTEKPWSKLKVNKVHKVLKPLDMYEKERLYKTFTNFLYSTPP